MMLMKTLVGSVHGWLWIMLFGPLGTFLGLSQRGGPNEDSEGPWVPK